MEPRLLLAGEGLLISEFLASNNDGLQDQDGEFSDWIEIYNPTNDTVDLENWHLTDDADDLTKWTFPTVMIAPNDFQVVFASGKDISEVDAELHTNFKLGSAGEYLALARNDESIAHEYSPEFPEQATDVSYGISFEGIELIESDSGVDIHIPENDSLGNNWKDPDFQIGEGAWTIGNSPVGFGPTTRGFLVRDVRSTGSVQSLEAAEALIAGEGIDRETTRHGVETLNYLDSAKDGHFEQNDSFPNGPGNSFAILATATLLVESTELYTFGISTDDGVSLKIDGEELIHADETRGPRDLFSSTEFHSYRLTAGAHTLELLKFQHSRDVELELFAAPGSHTEFNDNFQLLGNTDDFGLKVYSPGDGDSVTNIGFQMQGVNSSAYLRLPFNVSANDVIDSLSLQINYNDGFIAYLNGIEVARRNSPEIPTWDSTATAEKPLLETFNIEEIDISEHVDLLLEGNNILAIHGLNHSVDDGSFYIQPRLIGNGLLASEVRYFANPTPGLSNEAISAGIVDAPEFSVDRGFFEQSFQVEITSITDESTIWYTLDGSEPLGRANGIRYRGPLTIGTTTILRAAAFKPGLDSSSVETRTYIFIDDVARQPDDPEGFASTWAGFQADYGVDPDVVNTTQRGYSFEQALLSIPSISLTAAPGDLFGPNGVYSNSSTSNRGAAWERPASLEFIYPDGRESFQIDAGIRMHGNSSRNHSFTLKHPIRVLFKSQYGPSKLDYPLFPDSDVTQFDQILLRGASTDSWPTVTGPPRWFQERAQYTKDQWMRDTQNALGTPSSHGTYMHLYINGLYWGLYNPSERPTNSFAEEHFGGDKEEYDVLKDFAEVQAGNRTAWDEMMAIAAAGLETEEAYQRIQGNHPDGRRNTRIPKYLDVDNLADYMILHILASAEDWPHHNWWASRRRGPESEGFRFFVWDQEISNDTFERNQSGVSNANSPAFLYSKLRENPSFQRKFADRLQELMFNDGLLTPEANDARWMVRANEIDQAIVGESARWGDARRTVPYKREVEWLAEQRWMRETYWPQITNITIERFRDKGLYPLVDATQYEADGVPQHGGQLSGPLTIGGPNPRGSKVYYTLDGSDPLLPDGTLNPEALRYTEPITLTETAVVKSRINVGRIWTALNSAQFFVDMPAAAGNLAITEIHYHPTDPTDEEVAAGFVGSNDFEFIELQNVSDEPIDLTGVQFTTGIKFDFSAGDIKKLAPGEYLVLMSNREAFESRHGSELGVAGQYDGSLRDGGEQLVLVDRFGDSIHDFIFDDDDPWPGNADGNGNSLEIKDANGDYQDGNNWRSSDQLGGTPGRSSSEVVDEPPQILDIRIKGTSWTTEFLTHLENNNLGSGGFSLALLNADAEIIPWSNIDQIHVVFSEDVNLTESDLSLSGVNISDYLGQIGLIEDGFQYDSALFTATWTLSMPISLDKILLMLSDSITDSFGNRLDGESAIGNSIFPSGDGLAGGSFSYQLNILPGDNTQNGQVDNRDVQAFREFLLSSIGAIEYSIWSDADADGVVDIRDLQVLRMGLLSVLPEDDPQALSSDEDRVLLAQLSENASLLIDPGKTEDSFNRILNQTVLRRRATDVVIATLNTNFGDLFEDNEL